MSTADYDFKTIAAISTPPGYGGIGTIRVSGKEALAFTRPLFGNSANREFLPNQSSLLQLVDPDTHAVIDHAVVTFFRAPHSFTGEDVVEISCHGSPVVLKEVLRLLVAAGARLAEPGEFSLRAFLNGRIDLAQAEAIRDLIHAQTTYQAKLAARQLNGELSRQLRPLKDRLVELIVHFESAVEFVEDNLDSLDIERFTRTLDEMITSLERLAESYKFGRVVESGIKVALIGRPNVGKSSLFNALLGRDRAIVTTVPGTTRDTLTERISVKGIPAELIDTAGLRESEDFVERLGVERTRSAASDADFVIGVVDITDENVDEDIELFESHPPHLIALNKSDLDPRLGDAQLIRLKEVAATLSVSALNSEGIDDLLDHVYGLIADGSSPVIEGAIITNARHFAAIGDALESLRRATQALDEGFTEEVALSELHAALKYLGVITGETLIADIMNQIFSTFCIGK
jgi:tRNA modification GTPase